MYERQEEYADWLARLNIPLTDRATLEDLQTTLEEDFGYNTAQIDALTSAYVEETDFEHLGIHAVTITYAWGKDLRYGILGEPGLWGFESATRFAGERAGEEEYWTERMIERGLLRE